MELTRGLKFVTKTRTVEDVFGTVVWEITKVGLKTATGADAVECTIVSGTGDRARPGYTVIDTVANIQKNFEKGIARLTDEWLINQIRPNNNGSAISGGYEIDA